MPAETAKPPRTETPTEPPDGTEDVPKLAAADSDGFDRVGNPIALSDDGTAALVGARRDEGPDGANELAAWASPA